MLLARSLRLQRTIQFLLFPLDAWRGLTLLLALAAGVPAFATEDPAVALRFGVGSWNQGIAGELRAGSSAVEVEDDLNLADDLGIVAYIEFEHDQPVFPNLRLEYFDTSLSGDEQLERSIEVNGTSFGLSQQVNTQIELRQADAVLYYKVVDQQLSLDLGVAARLFDGDFAVASSSAVTEVEFMGAMPLLYANLRADLPLPGLWLGAQARGLGSSENRLLDVQIRAGYLSAVGLGAELGWRHMQLSFSDQDDLDEADIDLTGPYLMLNYHF